MRASVPGAAEPPDMFSLVLMVVSVLDPAVVVPKDSELMLKGEDLTATCNALSSLKTSTVWYKVHTLYPGVESLRSWICSATGHLCGSGQSVTPLQHQWSVLCLCVCRMDSRSVVETHCS